MAASLTSTLLCHDRRTVLPHPYRRRNRAGLRLYVCAGILLESGQAILGGVHRVRDQPAEHRPDPAKGRAADVRHDRRGCRRPCPARAFRARAYAPSVRAVPLSVPDALSYADQRLLWLRVLYFLHRHADHLPHGGSRTPGCLSSLRIPG